MIRTLLLGCFLVGILLRCPAQIPLNKLQYSDSLTTALHHAKTDSARARINFLLSDFWSYQDTLQALSYLNQGIQLAKQDPFLLALSHYYRGAYYFDNHPAQSEVEYLLADSLLQKFTSKETYFIRAKAWRNYGVLQQISDNDKKFAEVVLNKAIPLARQAGDSAYAGSCLQDVGLVFMNELQYDKAEIYYKQAIQALQSAGPYSSNLVNVYLLAAKNYIFSTKYDLAKAMLDNAGRMLAPYPRSEGYLDFYLVEGMYFTRISRYEEAINSFDKGAALAKEFNKTYDLQEILFQKYKTFTSQKQYGKAIKVLTALTTQPKTMSLVKNRLLFYHELAETNASLGDMKTSYKWLKLYTQLNDSLHESKLKNDINELEIKYKNAEHEKKIFALQADNEKAVLTATSQRLLNWLLIAVCGFLLIVTFFALLFYKNNKKLSVQKEINFQQQLNGMEQQQKIAFANAMLQGEEEERKRVARDLHDGLGSLLTGIKLNLPQLMNSDRKEGIDNAQATMSEHLDKAVNEVRRIARNMMPETLLRAGLEPALEDLCNSLRTESTQIHFQAFDIEKTIPRKIQITIYRIIQELLTNAIRHARASKIILQCSQNQHVFMITVEDNGVGFNPALLNEAAGLGLSNVRNRVEFLRGDMKIESVPGEGTGINIEVQVRVPDGTAK